MEGCLACDLYEGRIALPGGIIQDTGRWVVEHCVGPLGVGTLIVKPRRHVVHVSDLEDDEAGELGPVLQRAAAVVGELTRLIRCTSASGRIAAAGRFTFISWCNP